MSMLFRMSVKNVSNHKEYFLRQAESANFLHFWQNTSPMNTTLPALSAIVEKEALSSLFRVVSMLFVHFQGTESR